MPIRRAFPLLGAVVSLSLINVVAKSIGKLRPEQKPKLIKAREKFRKELNFID